jgi:iron complex transport system substrate-binding protein
MPIMLIRRTCILSLLLAFGAGALAAPPRIISLSPHITELLFAAGAGDRIVGVDDMSDYPPAVAGIARVGEAWALDVEGLLKLKPTLIVIWDSGTPPRRKEELRRLNLQLYVTEQHHRTISQRRCSIWTARRHRDRGSGGGGDAIARIAQAACAGYGRLLRFLPGLDRPHIAVGEHGYRSGVPCDATPHRRSGPWRVPRRVAVPRATPTSYGGRHTGTEGARQTADWGRFGNLRAVRNQHIFTVDPSLIGRMSPRILQGVRDVCDVLDRARNVRRRATDAPLGARLTAVSNKRQWSDDIARR